MILLTAFCNGSIFQCTYKKLFYTLIFIHIILTCISRNSSKNGLSNRCYFEMSHFPASVLPDGLISKSFTFLPLMSDEKDYNRLLFSSLYYFIITNTGQQTIQQFYFYFYLSAANNVLYIILEFLL